MLGDQTELISYEAARIKERERQRERERESVCVCVCIPGLVFRHANRLHLCAVLYWHPWTCLAVSYVATLPQKRHFFGKTLLNILVKCML
jgi:hypothetical protein